MDDHIHHPYRSEDGSFFFREHDFLTNGFRCTIVPYCQMIKPYFFLHPYFSVLTVTYINLFIGYYYGFAPTLKK